MSFKDCDIFNCKRYLRLSNSPKSVQLQGLKVRAIVPSWNMQITFYYLTFVYGSDYTNKLINVYTIHPSFQLPLCLSCLSR